MDKKRSDILERKINWLFDLHMFRLSETPCDDDKTKTDFLNRADSIIADETVDDEIDKTNLREQTKDTLGEDDGKWGEL